MRALILILLLLLSSCGPPERVRVEKVPAGRVPSIRVGVLVGKDVIRVTGTGPFSIRDLAGGERIASAGRGQAWTMKAQGAWIEATDPEGAPVGLFTGPIRLSPAGRDGRIRVSGTEYRGAVEIRGDHDGRLTAINEVDLEHYLRGVVPREIGHLREDQIEAVKAQAVAARTYALANRGRHAAKGFDLLATADDQVYRGYAAETPLTDRAIEETHGVVAVFKGRMITPFYSSTCGGRTESIRDAWRRRSTPYLRSVKDTGRHGAFCKASPVYRWKEQWDRATLDRILSLSQGRGTRVRNIRIRKRSKSGRVQLLEIKTNRGTVRVRGDRIRRVLRRPVQGFPLLRSTLFSLKVHRGRDGYPVRVTARGGGFGHGIGLCQYGAIGMATQGFRFDRILRHYYRGIHLQRLY